MKNLNFRVVISGIINGNQNTDYGFYVDGSAKRFDWCLYGGVENSTAGILLDRWISNITKSVDIRRFGKYASIGGGTIYTDNTQSIYDFIRQQEIDLQGKLLQVYEISGEVETLIYKGVCTTLSYSKNSLSIEFDDLTRYRESVISERFGADSFTPASFGEIDKAKLILKTDNVEAFALPILGKDGVFDVFFQLRKKIKTQPSNTIPEGFEFNLALESGTQLSFLKDFLGLPPNPDYSVGATWDSNDIPQNVFMESVIGDGVGIIRKIDYIEVLPLEFNLNILKVKFTESVPISEDSETEFTSHDEFESGVNKITYFNCIKSDLVLVGDSFESTGGHDGTEYYTIIDDTYSTIPNSEQIIVDDGNEITIIPQSLVERKKIEGVKNLEVTEVTQHEYVPSLNGTPFTPVDFPPVSWDLKEWTFYDLNKTDVGMFPLHVDQTEPAFTPEFNAFDIGNKNILDKNWNNGVRFRIPLNKFATVAAIPKIDSTKGGAVYFPLRLKVNTGGLKKFKLALGINVQTILQTVISGGGFDSGVYITNKNDFGTFVNSVLLVVRQSSGSTIPSVNTGNLICNVSDIKNLEYFDTNTEKWLSNQRQYYRNDTLDNTGFWYRLGDYDPNNPSETVGWRAYATGSNLMEVDIEDIPIDATEDIFDLDIGFLFFCKPVGFANVIWGQVDTTQSWMDLEIRNLGAFVEQEIDISDSIYSGWTGRKDPDSLDLLQKPSDIYEHILKLQRYKTEGLNAPAKGWGLEYIADYSNLIGTIPEVTGEYANQLFTEKELLTKNIKNELLRSMWSYGSQDWQGKEVLFKMADAFDQDVSRVEIDYVDIKKGSIREVKETNKADIFCMPSLKYDYDIGLDEYKKEIAVVNVEKETFADDNSCIIAQGLTPEQRALIWSKCRQLFLYYGVINSNPQTLTENKWIKTDADADKYMRRWLAWQGATNENVEPFSERRSLSFQVHYEYFREKELDVGSLIDLEVPFVSEQRMKGIINSVNINLQKGNEFVTVEVFVKVPELFDRVIEGGDRGDEIIESGDRDFNIIEGGQ